jgi:putative ABC transport system permease protein
MLGNAFPITAPPVDTRLLVPRIESGRWVRAADDRAIVVSRSLVQREPTLVLGRRVALDVGGRREEWTVVGIADAGPLPSAFVSRAAIVASSGEPGVSAVMVASAVPGMGAQVDLIQRVRADLTAAGFAVSGSQLVAENRRVMEDHLLMVVQFLAVMGWVMIAVGGMGLASTMSLAVLERTREIGVLRTIGARHGAIMGMIQTEGLVITLAAWLCAIPLSIPVSVALASAFSRVMLEVPPTILPSGAVVAEWLGVLVAACVVACAWPAVRATRVPIARALAYE